jgi:FtsH-binding integral membrane protein
MSMAIGQPARGQSDRVFFTGMALATTLAVFVGFSPSYFLRSAALAPLTPLYQVHGLLFTTWMLLIIVQTSLVAGRRTDIHRRVGVAGAVLAAAVFLMGVMVSIETLRRNGGPAGIDPRTFFAIPLGDMIVFGVLVTAGIVFRQHADTHKRLLLLATISVVTAGVARFFVTIGMPGPLGLFLGTDVFVLVLVVYDFALRGRLHPATLWGGALVVVFKPMLLAVAFTPAWLAAMEALR